MLDKHRHVLIVRSLPVDPITVRAKMELVVTLPSVWEQAVVDQFLCYGLQRRIAVEAPPKRSNQPGEIKTVHDFDELLLGLDFTHEVSVPHDATL
jgi:hypothetical protein